MKNTKLLGAMLSMMAASEAMSNSNNFEIVNPYADLPQIRYTGEKQGTRKINPKKVEARRKKNKAGRKQKQRRKK